MTVAGVEDYRKITCVHEAGHAAVYVAHQQPFGSVRVWVADGLFYGVAAQLGKLQGKDPRWRVLHAVPVGENGSDIDHVVIGPGGVFTLNAKHHPGAKIWVGGNTFMVNGQRQPYVRKSAHEARRAGRLLSAACGFPVTAVGVVVPVGADDVVIKTPPEQVHVVYRRALSGWLRGLPSVVSEGDIDLIYAAARRSTTWRTVTT